jgi:hypothetical protein
LTNSQIDPAAAIAISKLADPGAGKVIGSSSGAAAVFPPGYEFPGSYVEQTTSVTVSATTEATANTVVTAGAVTFDGATPVVIEFYAPYVQPASVATAYVQLVLYDGSSSIGLLGIVGNPAANTMYDPVFLRRRLTPAAASKTYSVRAFQANGNGTVGAGVGGVGANMPAYIRITKV